MAMAHHVLLLPFPFHSHVNAMLQLAHTLAGHGFVVTFVQPKKDLENLHDRYKDVGIRFVGLSDNLDADALPAARLITEGDKLGEASEHMIQLHGAFEDLLQDLMQSNAPVTYIVADFLIGWMHSVLQRFRLPNAMFYPGSAASILFHCRIEEVMKHVNLPVMPDDLMKQNTAPTICTRGILPLLLEDIPYSYHGVPPFPDYYQQIKQRTALALAAVDTIILINTFEELEKDALESFQTQVSNVIPIGPLLTIQTVPLNREEDAKKCMEWLENQADYSVLYVAFGTLVDLPQYQIENLAQELELSKQPFIWALGPNISKSMAEMTKQRLMEAQEDKALVVNWAPQQQVLSNRAIGGFLTHCGWNSILEGIAAGVPMLGLPCLYEQNLNCKYMVDEWGIGIKVGMGNGGVVEEGKIRQGINSLLVEEKGKRMREKALSLKKAALCRASDGVYKDFVSHVKTRLHVDKVEDIQKCFIKCGGGGGGGGEEEEGNPNLGGQEEDEIDAEDEVEKRMLKRCLLNTN